MTTIWRYMDLWKFQSILEKQSLFFSTAASQDDKLEGVYPLLAKLSRARSVANLPDEQQRYALHNQEVSDDISTHEIVLSCWHINDSENPRMWKDYLRNPAGIAIQTSRDALHASFEPFTHSDLLDIREVKYIDRTKDRMSLHRRPDVFFQKQESFSWENELRYAIDTSQRPVPPHPDWNVEWDFPDNKRFPIGIYVPIAVDTLVERIIVSPGAPDAFYEEVKNICGKYGLLKPIERSTTAP